MRACFILLAVASCTRAPPPEGPVATAPRIIEVLDELGRPSLSMVPSDGAYALVDFTGRRFGGLSTGASATTTDAGGAALARLAGDRVVDYAGTPLLLVRREAGKVNLLGPDGHLRYELEGDELLRDGFPVISPLRLSEGTRPLIGRLLALAEEPLEVRLVLVGAFALVDPS